MSYYTAWLIGSSTMLLLGCAGILWRFFQRRRGDRIKSVVSKAPHYAGGVLFIAAGMGLLLLTFVNLRPEDQPFVGLWWLCGFALGCCLAVPGVLLVASAPPGQPWLSDPATVTAPWSAYFGWALIGLGIAGGCIAFPITVVLVR